MLPPKPRQAGPAPRRDSVNQDPLSILATLNKAPMPESIEVGIDCPFGKEPCLPRQIIRPKALRVGPL